VVGAGDYDPCLKGRRKASLRQTNATGLCLEKKVENEPETEKSSLVERTSLDQDSWEGKQKQGAHFGSGREGGGQSAKLAAQKGPLRFKGY